jgi:hypothetical protein
VIGYSQKDISQLKNRIELLSRRTNTASFEYPKYWSKNINEIDEVEVDRNSDEFREI